MNENLIPINGEVRGVLYYSSLSSGEILSKAGNFQIAADGRTVVARNLNGRNRWKFVGVNQVVDFKPATK